MKYIRLFEQFEEGHKFDILDLFTISPNEVEELFFRELEKRNPDIENIQVFLDSGLVDVNTKGGEYGWTPLHRAAMYNHLELAHFLISSGAELNAKDKYGQTPLHLVADYNRLEIAKLLISSGAEVNARTNGGYTPLHRVAERNHLELAKLLISSGADLKARDNRARGPLRMAVENGCQKMAELLRSMEVYDEIHPFI